MTGKTKIAVPILLLSIAVLLIITISAGIFTKNVSAKIGVLLPLSGADYAQSKEVLDWLAYNFNKSGGIHGRPVELIYKDTADGDILLLAQEFAEDPSIQIVIGPQKSSELHKIAPVFLDSRKVLISPTATAGDIFRAYGKRDYIWRTSQSDIAQTRAILYELSTRGVRNIALIHTQDSYGNTFLEWSGFFCTELEMDLLNTVGYNDSSDLEEVLNKALEGNPEYIVIASYAQESARFIEMFNEKDRASKLFFTDATETNYILEEVGSAAIGIELLAPAASPDSGFEETWFSEFGYYPYDEAAATCDAFLLAAYTLARQESLKGVGSFLRRETVSESFKKIVYGTGSLVRWNEYEKAVEMILRGELINLEGASGPLVFDREFGVDPVEGYYSLNRIENREGVLDFYTTKRFSTSASRGVGLLDDGASAASTKAGIAKSFKSNRIGQNFTPAAERKNLRAVIISTSGGWENYRHQADALAVYQFLRSNGVSDDDIILFSIDDVPWMPQNQKKGDIRHEEGGPNLRENAVIDYSGDRVTPEILRKVLLGECSPLTPLVLESNENSNVFFYLVGHGMPKAINFMNGTQLTARSLAQIIDEMSQANRFRQMLVIAEACYGESLAMEIETPGVLFLTGASRMESSFAANYDPKIRQWLGDEFTARVIRVMNQPEISLEQLYLETYTHVAGSHVTLGNYMRFGDLQTPVSEFIRP